jgi:hypothetical protein
MGQLISFKDLCERSGRRPPTERIILEVMSEVYRNIMLQEDWSPAEARERLRNAYILVQAGLHTRENAAYNPFTVHLSNWIADHASELGELFDLLGVDVTKKGA